MNTVRKGQSKSDPHKRVEEKESEIPIVGIDYAYMEEQSSEDLGMPLLIVKDRKSGFIMADVVPEKGENDYAIKRLSNNLGILGHQEMIIKSDGEPAIVALKKAVKRERPENIMFEESPVGESRSNGETERAVQEAQGKIRSVKLGLEARYKRRIRRNDNIVPWMIRHAVQMRNRIRIGEDGRTCWKRLKGREFKREVAEFGENVWYLEANSVGKTSLKQDGKKDSGWE